RPLKAAKRSPSTPVMLSESQGAQRLKDESKHPDTSSLANAASGNSPQIFGSAAQLSAPPSCSKHPNSLVPVTRHREPKHNTAAIASKISEVGHFSMLNKFGRLTADPRPVADLRDCEGEGRFQTGITLVISKVVGYLGSLNLMIDRRGNLER